jgi:hypothetical protein
MLGHVGLRGEVRKEQVGVLGPEVLSWYDSRLYFHLSERGL